MNPEPTGLDQWNAVAEANAAPIDVAQLDALVVEYKAAKDDYDAKKKISNEADAKCEELRAKVLATLKAANKTKYHVDGIGTAQIVRVFSVNMPKDLEGKRQLFRHLQERNIALEYLTVNYASLNGYFNTEREKDPAFKLPGVAEPTTQERVDLRKETKKG